MPCIITNRGSLGRNSRLVLKLAVGVVSSFAKDVCRCARVSVRVCGCAHNLNVRSHHCVNMWTCESTETAEKARDDWRIHVVQLSVAMAMESACT